MNKDRFVDINPPIEVQIHLYSIEDGGRHNPIFPYEVFRPDMVFEHSGRQFWGQLTVESDIKPGETGVGVLSGVYPIDMEDSFKPGRVINLKMAKKIGTAKIL